MWHRNRWRTRIERKIDALTEEVHKMLPQLQTLIDNVTTLTTVDAAMRAIVGTAVATLNDLRQQIADLVAQADPTLAPQLQDLSDKVAAASADFTAQTDALVAASKSGTVAADEPAATEPA